MSKRGRSFGLARRIGRDVCRHWSGRLTLGRSFWINGVALGVLLALWAHLLYVYMHDSTTGRLELAGWGAEAVLCIVGVWQARGIWLAAGRTGTNPVLRLLARICVVVGALDLIVGVGEFATLWWEPVVRERFDVRVLGKPDEAELRGGLSDGASEALAQLLRSHPSVRTLHVTSAGGLLNEGLRVAALVRERHLQVVVDSWCESACTFVLLAGERRWMRPEATIGFHLGAPIGTRHGLARDDDMQSALLAVGAPKDFMKHVARTLPDDMWRPSQSELLSAHVITDVAQPDQFTFCPRFATVAGVRKSFELDGALAAIEDIEPERFQRMVDDYLAGPSRGATEAEMGVWLARERSTLFNEARCHPAVAVARARAAQLARVVAAISVRFPGRCAGVLEHKLDSTGLTPSDLGDDYASTQRSFIVESHRTPSADPSPEEMNEAHRALEQKISNNTLRTMRHFKESRAGSAAELCAAAVEYHRAKLELEPELIARLIRSCPGDP